MMRRRSYRARAALAALTALALTPLSAAAQPSRLSLSGFATVGAVAVDRDDTAFYRPSVNQPSSDRPDFGPDTLLAVQGSLRLGGHTDATVQLMSSEDTSGSYGPRVTWAFVRHVAAPGLEVRLGRLRVPFMMLSDSLYVNYANPWIRPPIELYGLNPFSDLDGGDLLYQTQWGDVDVEIHPYFGRGRITFPEGSAEIRATRGLNLTLTRGEFSLHLGHGEADLSLHRGDIAYHRLTAALRSVGLDDVVADLSGDDGRARFDSVGLQWDDGTWQVIAEYARRDTDRYVASAHAWYVTAGRRFGTVMPFVTYARQRMERPVSTAKIPAQFGRLATAFDAFLTSRNNAQRSATVGVRWDFLRNAAFKAELTRAFVDNDSWGNFFPDDPTSDPHFGERAINMLGVAVDVAF